MRQREIREMRFSSLQLENGIYYVSLKPEDHKTGSKTNKCRRYPLFVTEPEMQKTLSQDLKYFIENIRPKNLEHDCIFFIRQHSTCKKTPRRRGDPIVNEGVLNLNVRQVMYRTTYLLFGADNARRTTCHDFRRIIATWVCTCGEPRHLSIYAEMLGHSETMLRSLYAKLNPGALSRQASIAYQEIVANELKARGDASDSDASEQLDLCMRILQIAKGMMEPKQLEQVRRCLTS
jgi:integrase